MLYMEMFSKKLEIGSYLLELVNFTLARWLWIYEC